jgi:hypothetical protein
VTSFVTWIKFRNAGRKFLSKAIKDEKKSANYLFSLIKKERMQPRWNVLSFIWPQRFIARNLLISTHPRTIVFLALGHETVFLCHSVDLWDIVPTGD